MKVFKRNCTERWFLALWWSYTERGGAYITHRSISDLENSTGISILPTLISSCPNSRRCGHLASIRLTNRCWCDSRDISGIPVRKCSRFDRPHCPFEWRHQRRYQPCHLFCHGTQSGSAQSIRFPLFWRFDGAWHRVWWWNLRLNESHGQKGES